MARATAQAKQVGFMCFMMYMMGSGLHMMSILMTRGGLAGPVMAIWKSGEGERPQRSRGSSWGAGWGSGGAVCCGAAAWQRPGCDTGGVAGERALLGGGRGGRGVAAQHRRLAPRTGEPCRQRARAAAQPGAAPSPGAAHPPAPCLRPPPPAAFPRDPEGQLDTLTPRLVYCLIHLGQFIFGLYKLNGMGLLPTHASDWLAGAAPPPMLEHAYASVM